MTAESAVTAARADQLVQQALALHRAGQLPQAGQIYQQALGLDPQHVDATHLLGCLLLQVGQGAKALVLLQQAVSLAPDNIAILNNLGQCQLRLGDANAALQTFQTIETLAPSGDSLHIIGVAFDALKRHDEAIAAYRQALQRIPNHRGALTNLLNRLRLLPADSDGAKERLRLARQALQLHDIPADLTAMAAQILLQGNAADQVIAAAAVNAKLAVTPMDSRLHAAKGLTLLEQGTPEAAMPWLERAVAAAPKDLELLALLATAYLAAGHLHRGFRAFDARLRHPAFGGHVQQLPNVRRWQGEALAGQTVRILSEQGLGDMLQFMRLAPALLSQGAARVELEMPARLHRLAQSLTGVSTGQISLVLPGNPTTQAQFQTPVISALAHLGVTTDDDISALCSIPYLHAEADRVAFWGNRLNKVAPRNGRPRIGIAWQGNPRFSGDARRSIPLAALTPLADHAQLIALQRGAGLDQAADLQQLCNPGPDLDASSDGFIDTAAVMQHCDLIICCCTSIAHLAGALGRPVWLALSHAPDWRWQVGRNNTAWYPEMRLFRQQQAGDWPGVISSMISAFTEGHGQVPALGFAS